MPKAAAARKPAAPAPKVPARDGSRGAGVPGSARKARAKARKKPAAPKPKKLLMTPSEKHKVLFAAALLLTFLLAVVIHSGEMVHTATGWMVHFHDLKGHLVVSVSLPF